MTEKMTEKRFMIDDTGTLIDMTTRNTYDYVSEVCSLLNELNDENEQLKSDRHRFEEETRLEITDNMDRVFDCIDKKINRLQRNYDFGQQEVGACPMHNLKHSINTLKELKKELQE